MEEKKIIEEVANRIMANLENVNKEILNAEEAAKFLGISMAGLYKFTHKRQIPYYKPMGKLVYFKRRELEEWLLRNRVATAEEIQDAANRYCMRK